VKTPDQAILQTAATHKSPPALVHNVLRSPGQPLDPDTRAYMEPRFGHDFGNVRVHADARANESSTALAANAYTAGRNIVFGAGRYVPGSPDGRRLIAHELTHVVQQAGAARGLAGTAEVSRPGDMGEREAEHVAAVVHQGERAPPIRHAGGGIQRDAGSLTCGPEPDDNTEAKSVEPVSKPGVTPACPISATGTVSKISWGETSGIYPANSHKFQPEKWDAAKTCELLKMRGAVHAVGQRGEKVHTGTPKTSDPIEQKLTPYHFIENFPPLDPEIEDAQVKWFYLSTSSEHAHTGIQGGEKVKTYGKFYNIGGGDVPSGDIYVHFYRLKA